MKVLTGALLVKGIESEITIHRCVLADPGKRLDPRILGNRAGELEVRGSRKCLSLHVEHKQPQRNKEQQPSENMCPQNMTADQAAGNQNENEVKQMQVAHRLQRLQPFQADRQHDD